MKPVQTRTEHTEDTSVEVEKLKGLVPKYSAAIISRNEETHIKKTLESILNQSIKPYKVYHRIKMRDHHSEKQGIGHLT